jgi:hypothetical protein
VRARYHYTVSGRTYTGTQVSEYSPDSLGGFFQRTYDLHGRLVRHDTIDAHVNPDKPDEAVLLPVWRPEVFLFQGALFAFFAFGAWVAFGTNWPRPVEPTTDTVDADDESGSDDVDVDFGERLSAKAAWGGRLVLAGLVLLAAAYVLLERGRGDDYAWLDRIVASQVTARGRVFVTPPDPRVASLFEVVRSEVGAEADMTGEAADATRATYVLRVHGPDRTAALAALTRLQERLGARYQDETGASLTTFVDAYVAPELTAANRQVKTGVLAVLLGLGVLGVLGGLVLRLTR